MEMIAEQQLVLTDYLLKGGRALRGGARVSQSEIDTRSPAGSRYRISASIVMARTVVDK